MARSRGNKSKPNFGSSPTSSPSPATYEIEFSPSAAKQLAEIPAKFRGQIIAKIDRLKTNPTPAGVVPIRDSKGAYRITSGDYRILYEIERGRLVVMVLKVGDRKDVYKGL